VRFEGSAKPHVHQKYEIFRTNIASTMACPNFKNGPKNGLGPLGVKQRQIPTSWKTSLIIILKKNATPSYSPTINQLPLQIPYTNCSPVHSPQFSPVMVKNIKYYMTARKAFVLNAALLDNSKLLSVPLKMLNSPTKTYIFFILTLKTLLDPLIMPDYSPL
jgi:hypothetical protein